MTTHKFYINLYIFLHYWAQSDYSHIYIWTCVDIN